MSVSATLSGLAAGVTFHYTLCATNTYGTKCDTTDHTFVTNQPPTAIAEGEPGEPGRAAGVVRRIAEHRSGRLDPVVDVELRGHDLRDRLGRPRANIVHTYPSAGSYTASLTVTDDRGATSTSSQITVVVPSISIADASVTEGQTASFVVTLSAVSAHAVTVDYKTADGTANEPPATTRRRRGR